MPPCCPQSGSFSNRSWVHRSSAGLLHRRRAWAVQAAWEEPAVRRCRPQAHRAAQVRKSLRAHRAAQVRKSLQDHRAAQVRKPLRVHRAVQTRKPQPVHRPSLARRQARAWERAWVPARSRPSCRSCRRKPRPAQAVRRNYCNTFHLPPHIITDLSGMHRRKVRRPRRRKRQWQPDGTALCGSLRRRKHPACRSDSAHLRKYIPLHPAL